MTPTERLHDLLPGLPIRESNGSASVVLPDGSLVDASADGAVYVYRYRGGAVCGAVKVDDIETLRADLHATASAWMDAVLGPLTDSELVDVADPEAHYTDGREVGPLRNFEISPRMKRTLSNMPDGGKLIVGDAVWSRVPKQGAYVLDFEPVDGAQPVTLDRTTAVGLDEIRKETP